MEANFLATSNIGMNDKDIFNFPQDNKRLKAKEEDTCFNEDVDVSVDIPGVEELQVFGLQDKASAITSTKKDWALVGKINQFLNKFTIFYL